MKQPRQTLVRTLAIITLFYGTLIILVLGGYLHSAVLYYHITISIITCTVYAIDKSAARTGRTRTRERTLHLWSLAGGWTGALLAQQIVRHKSSKQPFRRIFYITVLCHVSVLVLYIAY